MSKTSVIGYPRVDIRCQFDNIPGVTHITMEFDPRSRGNQVNGSIKFFGGIGGNELMIRDEEIGGCAQNKAKGTLALFNEAVFNELSQAIVDGMKTLTKMVKASGYTSNPF